MEINIKDTAVFKGIAISLMLWHHLFYTTLEYGVLSNYIGVFGKVCVSFFLFLSGYGLAKQYNRYPSNKLKYSLLFVIRKLAKFFMSYWFIFVLIVATGLFLGRTLSEAYPNLNRYKSLILDFWGQMGYLSYIPTWWFNKLIIQLYILFPLLLIIFSRKWLGLISLIVLAVTEQLSLINIFSVVEGGMFAFCLGIFIAIFPIKITKSLSVALILTAIIIALIIIRFNLPYIRFTLIDAIFVVTFVGLFKTFCLSHYSFPIFTYLGNHSANMYLIHSFFIIMFPLFCYQTNMPIIIFLTLLIASLLASIIVDKLRKISKYNILEDNIVKYIQFGQTQKCTSESAEK